MYVINCRQLVRWSSHGKHALVVLYNINSLLDPDKCWLLKFTTESQSRYTCELSFHVHKTIMSLSLCKLEDSKLISLQL